jgi:hypothetical protein
MTFEVETMPTIDAGTLMPALGECDTTTPVAASLVPLSGGDAAESGEHDFEVEWPPDYTLDQGGYRSTAAAARKGFRGRSRYWAKRATASPLAGASLWNGVIAMA